MTLSPRLLRGRRRQGVDFVKTAFEAVESERLEDDTEVLQVARLGIGEVGFRGAADCPRPGSSLLRAPCRGF